MESALGLALDGLGEIFGRDTAEREIDAGKVLSIECIELRVVCRAVLGAKPPTPIAALGGKQ